MVNGRNPKPNVDDPEPLAYRNPNDGTLEVTPEWVTWHLSFKLTREELADLQRRLTELDAYAELLALSKLDEPTRYDHRQLLCAAESRCFSPSRLSGLTW